MFIVPILIEIKVYFNIGTKLGLAGATGLTFFLKIFIWLVSVEFWVVLGGFAIKASVLGVVSACFSWFWGIPCFSINVLDVLMSSKVFKILVFCLLFDRKYPC